MAEVPVQPQSQSQPTSKGINWKTITIGTVIGGLIVGIGVLGFYLYQGQTKETISTQVTTPKKATDSAKQATPSAEKDETADWKKLIDNILGFQIKYPSSWFLEPTEDKSEASVLYNFDRFAQPPRGLKESEYKISFRGATKSKSEDLNTYVSKIETENTIGFYEDQKKVTVDNYNAYQHTYNVGSKDYPGRYIFITYIDDGEGNLIIITGADENISNTYNLILDTFKFLN